METCRTCAKCDFVDGLNWHDLFGPEIAKIHVELINWNLGISQNDGLPQKICSDCFFKFCTVYKFRLACEEAQVKLNNIFGKSEVPCVNDDDGVLKKLSTSDTEQQLKSMYPSHNTEDELLHIFDLADNIIEEESSNTSEYKLIETLPTKDTTYTVNQTCSLSNNNEILFSGTVLKSHVQNDELTDEEDMAQFVGNVIEEFEPIINCTESLGSCNKGKVRDDFSYACKYCLKVKEIPSQQFLSQADLLAHIMATHDAQLPYNCPYCQLGFRDAASRTVHIKAQHVEKIYTCEVCGRKYADRFNLRHHVEKYHSETDFECTLCEKRFYSRKSLNYHMKWHNPERQFKCGFCDRLFINQRHLKCHEATHTGVRNSEYCTFCGKA